MIAVVLCCAAVGDASASALRRGTRCELGVRNEYLLVNAGANSVAASSPKSTATRAVSNDIESRGGASRLKRAAAAQPARAHTAGPFNPRNMNDVAVVVCAPGYDWPQPDLPSDSSESYTPSPAERFARNVSCRAVPADGYGYGDGDVDVEELWADPEGNVCEGVYSSVCNERVQLLQYSTVQCTARRRHAAGHSTAHCRRLSAELCGSVRARTLCVCT